MEIRSAEFVTSIAAVGAYREAAAGYACGELCVVGRSNVGKSSFINMLAGRNKLAKTSSTPGRTRLINLFDFNRGQFMLVDLPGYGYAAAAKNEQEKWSRLIDGYLESTEKLLQIFMLVDLRHPPSVLDKTMMAYLYGRAIPFTVVATKADKLSRAEAARGVMTVAKELGIGRDDVIPVSNTDRTGRDAVLARIESILTRAAE